MRDGVFAASDDKPCVQSYGCRLRASDDGEVLRAADLGRAGRSTLAMSRTMAIPAQTNFIFVVTAVMLVSVDTWDSVAPCIRRSSVLRKRTVSATSTAPTASMKPQEKDENRLRHVAHAIAATPHDTYAG